jgi:hypothetical protein
MKTICSAKAARCLLVACACAAAAVFAGCGDTSNKSSISGKVTYQGAPVTGGMITATGGKDLSMTIVINPDGTFMSQDVPPGSYKIAVSTDSVAPASAMPGGGKDYPAPGGASAAKKVMIPDKFKNPETSGITWTVKSGSQTLPIDLGQ